MELGVFDEKELCNHDYGLEGYDDQRKAWLWECDHCHEIKWEYEE